MAYYLGACGVRYLFVILGFSLAETEDRRFLLGRLPRRSSANAGAPERKITAVAFIDAEPSHAIPSPTNDRAGSAHYAGPNRDAHSHFKKCGFLRVRSAAACVRRFSDATSPSTDDLWTRLDGAVAKVSLNGHAKL